MSEGIGAIPDRDTIRARSRRPKGRLSRLHDTHRMLALRRRFISKALQASIQNVTDFDRLVMAFAQEPEGSVPAIGLTSWSTSAWRAIKNCSTVLSVSSDKGSNRPRPNV